MTGDVPANGPASARFTRSAFILGSVGLAASLAGVHPGRLLGSATAATAVAGCEWIPWEMVPALTSPTNFRAKDAELEAEGYRLVRVSGSGTPPSLTGIWEYRPDSDHIFELALSRADFKDLNRTHERNGYRLLAVDGFGLNGAERYNGIWERSAGSAKFQLGITAPAFRDKMVDFLADGYRLVDVSGFESNGNSRFAGLWRNDGPTSVSADIDMTEEEFVSKTNTNTNDGLVPVDVSAYEAADTTRYAAIWSEFSASIGVKEGLDSAALGLESDSRRYRGQRPVMVDAYPRAHEAAYTTLWRRDGITDAAEDALVEEIGGPLDEGTPFMEEFDVPGLSLAFAKNGRLVYARGFGVTAKDGTEPVTVHSRFRIGSASKPITAVAIMRLVQEGTLALDDPVFGPEIPGADRQPLLGTRYGQLDWGGTETEVLRQVTLRQLLEHTAGWPNGKGHENEPPNPMDAPRWTHPDNTKYPEWKDQSGNAIELDRENLIDYVITHSKNPTAVNTEVDTWSLSSPGSHWDYSGFGYLLLTKIIECKSGMTYEEYVKQVIVDDPDSTLEMCPRKGVALSNEVSYYHPQGDPHDGFQVWRRAGGGGWVASAIDLVRFMTRVDGEESTGRDAINCSTLDSMLTPSAASMSTSFAGLKIYGLGWALDGEEYDGTLVDYLHGGNLKGANSVMARVRIDGSVYCWAAVKNTLIQPDSDLDEPMREWFDLISEWLMSAKPCLDLFRRWSTPAREPGDAPCS